MLFSIRRWGGVEAAFECSVEGGFGIESDIMANPGHGVSGVCQCLCCRLKTKSVNPVIKVVTGALVDRCRGLIRGNAAVCWQSTQGKVIYTA